MPGIFKVVGDFGKRSMNTEGVVYPYWENAARLLEDYMALTLILPSSSACFRPSALPR